MNIATGINDNLVYIVKSLNGPRPTVIDTTCRFEIKQRALDNLAWHCFKGDVFADVRYSDKIGRSVIGKADSNRIGFLSDCNNGCAIPASIQCVPI